MPFEEYTPLIICSTRVLDMAYDSIDLIAAQIFSNPPHGCEVARAMKARSSMMQIEYYCAARCK